MCVCVCVLVVVMVTMMVKVKCLLEYACACWRTCFKVNCEYTFWYVYVLSALCDFSYTCMISDVRACLPTCF